MVQGESGRRLEAANWKAWGLCAASLLLAAYSFGLLYEGFIADHYSAAFSFPFVDEPAAWRAYDRLTEKTPIAERQRVTQRLIMADPANPDSWNALSYSEFLKAGGMSPPALTALDHSYAVSFFDRTGGVWRIGFAMENWKDLPISLRKDVLVEAGVMLKDPTQGPKLRVRLKSIQNPVGRVAAAMVLALNTPS